MGHSFTWKKKKLQEERWIDDQATVNFCLPIFSLSTNLLLNRRSIKKKKKKKAYVCHERKKFRVSFSKQNTIELFFSSLFLFYFSPLTILCPRASFLDVEKVTLRQSYEFTLWFDPVASKGFSTLVTFLSFSIPLSLPFERRACGERN